MQSPLHKYATKTSQHASCKNDMDMNIVERFPLIRTGKIRNIMENKEYFVPTRNTCAIPLRDRAHSVSITFTFLITRITYPYITCRAMNFGFHFFRSTELFSPIGNRSQPRILSGTVGIHAFRFMVE